MPTTVSVHQLSDLARAEEKNEILLDTNVNTELHIIALGDHSTIIKFPYGNKFEVIDGYIIIYD